MKKYCLCFVMPGCYPLFRPELKETFGGSEVELYNMARYFSQQQGFNVTFLVGDYGQKASEDFENIRVRKLKYLRPEATGNPLHKILKIVLLIKTLFFQKSDIFITKTASELLGWMVLINKWLRGKKVIYRLGSDRDTDLSYWKQRSKRLYTLYKLGLQNCDQIICQSGFQQAQMLANCGLHSIVIKNVFPLFQREAPLKKEYILWVSRCMALKRPLLFLEMARLLPQENFVMIMPINQESKVYAEEQITLLSQRVAAEAKTIPNLKLIGFVPFNKIQHYYDRAKIFVNTSEFEGFPNSFIQACLGRTGILSMKVDPDGFILKNKLGLCCRDDFHAAVGFLANLDDRTLQQYGDNAYSYVLQNHDIEKIAPQYIKIFEDLTKGWFRYAKETGRKVPFWKASGGKIPFWKISGGKVPFWKMPVGGIPFWKMTGGKVPIGKKPVGNIHVGKQANEASAQQLNDAENKVS